MTDGITSGRLMEYFNDAINSRDLDQLTVMMTESHVSMDSSGESFNGRDVVADAWRGFFSAFPDYRNGFERILSKGDTAIAVGLSV
jgi:ketosteroid isomerase-like protein